MLVIKLNDLSHIFRAYDIRGLYGSELTPEIAVRIGKAIGTFYSGKYLVAHDIRASSGVLSAALMSGLLSAGCDVLFGGLMPIGCFLYSMFKRKVMGAYVTASHLPPEYNGVKLVYPSGLYFSASDISTIREIFLSGNFKEATFPKLGSLTILSSLVSEYVDFLSSEFSNLNVKIVVDCGNGTTALVASKVFSECGISATILNGKVDPLFPARGAEPTADNIGQLRQQVVKERALFGVAYDGDGDRALFVDYSGRVLLPEEAAIIIMEGLGLKGDIVASIDASMILEDYAKNRGLNVIRVPVGHNHIVRKAREVNATVGVERSGHMLVSKYFGLDDGILMTLVFASALREIGEDIGKILPKRYISRSVKVWVDERLKFKIVEKIAEKFSREYPDVILIDGVKVMFDRAWLLIRASNTEPVVRITVEAPSLDEAKELLNKGLRAVREIEKNIR